MNSKLLVTFFLIVTLFDFSYSAKEEDLLLKKFEEIKSKAVPKCSTVKWTKKHLNEAIAKCVQRHLDNPPFPIEEKYMKVYKVVKKECWETPGLEFCKEGVIEKSLKCTIPKVIMYVEEGKKLYEANKPAVIKLVDKIMPCIMKYIDEAN